MENGRELLRHSIGRVAKQGRLLSLSEAHAMVCETNHDDFTYAHDPVVDVVMTRCVFNYIIGREQSYHEFLRKVN